MNIEKLLEGTAGTLLAWAGGITLAVIGFYLLNHFAMEMQGLPLNLDLTPAQ